MNPHAQFCHNPACSVYGKVGLGNIGIHSRKEARYVCKRCDKPFAATKGTALYRLRHAPEEVARVLTLLAHGCPRQAIVAAFGLDERTVADWQRKAGQHSQQFHEHMMLQHPIDVGHAQADELSVKTVGGRVWMGLAIAVPSRFWLGGVIGAGRDLPFLLALIGLIRKWAQHPAILICVDGLAGYGTAVRRVFRRRVATGKPGRPRLEPETGWMLGQVVKQYAKRRVVSVTQKSVVGTPAAIRSKLKSTGGGTQINTAYIERLNATFRSVLAPLVRRGRALARTQATLQAGMYLVGCVYNFATFHESLRLTAPEGCGRKWIERTPAMAAGLTGERWTVLDLMRYPVPPVPAAGRQRRRPRAKTAPPAGRPLAA
jgi:transposase-like protein